MLGITSRATVAAAQYLALIEQALDHEFTGCVQGLYEGASGPASHGTDH